MIDKHKMNVKKNSCYIDNNDNNNKRNEISSISTINWWQSSINKNKILEISTKITLLEQNIEISTKITLTVTWNAAILDKTELKNESWADKKNETLEI